MIEPAPFQIAISEEVLDDLSMRLNAARLPDAEVVDDWTQGVPRAVLTALVEYWRTDYDWRSSEALLNGFDQFVVPIDGIDVHFVHVRSPHADATPLLITHGWPGSIVEFLDIIGPLTDPTAHGGTAADAFHVVCPSLPGFGFSGKPTEPGWGVERIADAWAELMTGLGYERFGAQGGDWGGIITSALGERHLDRLIGIHLTLVLGGGPSGDADPSPEALAAFAALDHYINHDSGYSKQQGTRPQTLGYALADSPVGQLAWILEKFHAWTDTDGSVFDVIDRDRLLDNVMLYWCTNSAASSARIYWESFGSYRPERVDVPLGVAAFPKEIFPPVREWAESCYSDIRHWTTMDRGGHFAAMEVPELLIADVRTFFNSLRED